MFTHRSASKVKANISSTIKAHLIRGAFYLLPLLAATLPAFVGPEPPAKISHRTLTFAERVAYQRAIEEVYWRHRIWPKDHPDAKPSLDAVMTQAHLEKKVADYVRKSQALQDYWQRPIKAEQLQAEMERMAQHTKQPEVLRELFAALGNDPFVIAECLVRPVLAERLITSFSAHDQNMQGELKVRPESRRASADNLAGYYMAAASASYWRPTISDRPGGCIDETWTGTSTTNAPAARASHTAVWTGSEMIVWGGYGGSYLNTGGRYDPSTDSWAAISTGNAPSARAGHTAVWTGNEMIVWGGDDGHSLNTGGRYNPATNTWTPTSTTNAPVGRLFHTALWSGNQMVVWGGWGEVEFNTGGRYDPSTDSWTATSTISAPAARLDHSAVWTGSEMIVWGGSPYTNTGGRYEPSTDSWTATSLTNAPEARGYHTAVWTGSEMIVWGGSSGIPLNTGGRYNPGTNTWIATPTTNVPSLRFGHTAVWTGNEMIIWGGFDDNFNIFNTGGRYNPGTNSWIATSISNAPQGRFSHRAVWTGSEMIVWGGIVDLFNNTDTNTGGRYCAAAPSATPTPTASATPTSSPTPTCSGCSVTSPNCGTTVLSPPTDFIVHLNPPGPDAIQASDFTVNGIPADSFMIVSGGAEIHFYFNTSPAVQGENTIHIVACAFFCASGSVPEFTCTFLYEPSTPTPTTTATSTPRPSPTARPALTPRPRPTPPPRP